MLPARVNRPHSPYFRAFILALFLGLFTACKKEKAEPDVLPPISRNGANAFGAVVNGKIITARGNANFSGGIYADEAEDSCMNCWLPPDSSDLFLRIKHKDFPTTFIYLTDPRHTAEWQLNKSTLAFWEFGKVKAYMEIGDRRSGLTTEGFIRSDFYTRDDGIFSAEFSFHCINPKTCQEYSVTDGRIDVNLNTISYFP
jgi:hypothetical protein